MAVGWARWLEDGAWALAPALPLTGWPCGLGQAPALSGLQFSICTMKPLGNIVTMQDVASESCSSLKGSQCQEVSPGLPEPSVPFDYRLRVQADARSPWELLEVEPQVMERSRRGSDYRLGRGEGRSAASGGKGLISGSGPWSKVGTEETAESFQRGRSGGAEDSEEGGRLSMGIVRDKAGSGLEDVEATSLF